MHFTSTIASSSSVMGTVTEGQVEQHSKKEKLAPGTGWAHSGHKMGTETFSQHKQRNQSPLSDWFLCFLLGSGGRI